MFKKKVMSKKTLIHFGVSYISVPLLNATKEDYENMKKKRDATPLFKAWVRLRYSPKSQTIVASCMYKRKREILDVFLGNGDYT